LTNKQRHQIAVWLIENGHVTQDKNADHTDFTLWRTKKSTAETEINAAGLDLPQLSLHHLIQSLNFFNEVNKCFGYKINLPPIQDTVEMDRLTAQNKDLKSQVDRLQKELDIHRVSIKQITDYLSVFHKIAQLIPAEAFKKR